MVSPKPANWDGRDHRLPVGYSKGLTCRGEPSPVPQSGVALLSIWCGDETRVLVSLSSRPRRGEHRSLGFHISVWLILFSIRYLARLHPLVIRTGKDTIF